MIDPRQPSPSAARAHLAQMTRARQAVDKGSPPPLAAVVWPAGLDRSLLSTLPLTVRVSNCLNRAKLMSGNAPITVAALLRTPSFGRTSLADFVRSVEKYLVDCTLTPSTQECGSPEADVPTVAAPVAHTDHNESEKLSDGSDSNSPASLLTLDRAGAAPFRRWNLATEGFRSLLATSADVLGTATLADALRPELVRLAGRMRLDTALRSVGLHEAMLGTASLPALVSRRLQSTLDGFTENERAVVHARLVQSPVATLEEAGLRIGVTRERVRQIQVKVEPKIEAALGTELHVIALTLQERLDPIVAEAELNQHIDRVIPALSASVATLFRNALIRAMRLTLNHGLYANDQAEQLTRDVRDRAQELADDVGLVPEQQLVESLPDVHWRRVWPRLRRRSALHTIHGSLSLRDSAKARAKAALLSIGRPATREEIGALCGYEAKQVGAYLANVASVVKADRDRWGLRDWVDDVYDGIVGEIIQRIDEDGGVTTTDRLLTELPSKFNVSPQSVRAYMHTSRFEVRDGLISLANPASIRLRDLDDVVHGRDEDGAPFWTFVVETRHFRGYSVVGVPPEFAKALGCEPESGVDVAIENLPNCRALSLHWRLASTTGASLGYLAEPLRLLGLQSGDRARVAIAARRSIRLSPEHGTTPLHPQEADATLARMLRRRRAI